NGITPLFRARTGELYHHDFTETIRDHARQTIRLTVNETLTTLPDQQRMRRPACHTGRNTALEENVVDAFGKIEVPHARANLRLRRPGSAAQGGTGRGHDFYRITGTGTAFQPVHRS